MIYQYLFFKDFQKVKLLYEILIKKSLNSYFRRKNDVIIRKENLSV